MAARIISAICRFGAALSELLLLRAKRKPKAEAENAVREAREAVGKHDVAAVNRIIEESRLKRGGAAEVSVVALLAVLCLGMAIVSGCVRTMIIPADREVAEVEIEGVHYWLVPDATYSDIMEGYVRDSRRRRLEDGNGL